MTLYHPIFGTALHISHLLRIVSSHALEDLHKDLEDDFLLIVINNKYLKIYIKNILPQILLLYMLFIAGTIYFMFIFLGAEKN